MEKRYGLIQQNAGIGDIFYTQKIAKRLIETRMVEKIIWPVLDVYDYMNDYMGSDTIEYVPIKDFKDPTGLYNKSQTLEAQRVENISNDYDNTHWVYIPLEYSDKKFPGLSVMLAKYKFCNMLGDHHDWEDYFSFKRFEEKELQLKEHVGVKEGEDFILTSGQYGTPPNSLTRRIPHEGNKKIIQIKSYPGFSVFDWCWLFENASEIHMVETCFIYLLEKLSLKGKVFNLYSKWNPAFWHHIGHIPKRVKWNFCNW